MAIYLYNKAVSFAQRYIREHTEALNTSYERLASGKRINSAKDDPAGFQICNRLTSEINGLEQGNRNAQDGISLAQTVEGALEEIDYMLQKVRTLAIQSANGTNSAADRAAINGEAQQLFEEINRIANDSTFAGSKILDGSKGVVSIQVGAYANQTINFDLSTNFSVAEIAKTIGGETETTFEAGFDLTSADSSQKVLEHVDKLIEFVSGKRGMLGGVMNRFESTIRYQSNTAENLMESRSRIQDCDYAAETANLIQRNIQLQAATTILSQANQQKSIILSLIQGAFG